MTAIQDLLVGVGAQQAGLGFLMRTLARHPEIFVPPLSDLHYLDHRAELNDHLSVRKRRSRARKFQQRLWTQWYRAAELKPQREWWRSYGAGTVDAAWYARLFADRGGRRLAAEGTPDYARVGRSGFEHLAAIAPGVRTLLLLRNPVSRDWAQVLHQCQADGLEASRLDPALLADRLWASAVVQASDYRAMLADLDAVLGAERCLVLFYEDLRAHPARIVSQVCRFLDVSDDPRLFPELGRRPALDAGAVGLPSSLHRELAERHQATILAVAERLGRLPESWERELARVQTGAAASSP